MSDVRGPPRSDFSDHGIRARLPITNDIFNVSTKCPDDLRVLDAVGRFDGFPGPAESLSTKRGPNPSAKRELWGGALDPDTVEGGLVICFGDILIVKQSGTTVHR